MKKVSIYVCLLSLAGTVLTACGRGGAKEGKETVCVKTAVVVGTGGAAELCYPGKTKSVEDVNVAFRVSGTLERVLVHEGQYVRRGQLLATMDSRDYRVQLRATEAEYARVKADAERVTAMWQENNVSASDYDKARYGLQQMEEKLAHQQHQVADTRLTAPMDGYIQHRLHEGGETVSAGMPVVSMFSADGVEVEVFVPASDYARRDQLLGATCSFTVQPGVTFPLEVVRLSHEANASQLYMARLRIKGNYDRSKITPGMTTMVYATYNDTVGTSHVRIPTSAIACIDGRTTVFVVDTAQGVVHNRRVKTTRLDLDGNAVVVDGLKAGEHVVTAGVRLLHDGQQVREVEPPSKANVGGLL